MIKGILCRVCVNNVFRCGLSSDVGTNNTIKVYMFICRGTYYHNVYVFIMSNKTFCGCFIALKIKALQ